MVNSLRRRYPRTCQEPHRSPQLRIRQRCALQPGHDGNLAALLDLLHDTDRNRHVGAGDDDPC